MSANLHGESEEASAAAEIAAAAGEERLRRHRAARDRARSSELAAAQHSSERSASSTALAASHGTVEPRAAAEHAAETRGGGRADSRPAARSHQAPGARPPRQAVGASSRSPSAASLSRRQRGKARGPSRGEAAARDDLASAPHRQEPEDLEVHWQTYLRTEEYLTFQATVDSLRSLPPMDQLTERRVDFEVLLHLLHRLGCTLEVEHVSKSYRAHYSPDVQLCGYLYSTLLTAFTLLPSYVLNGQEFYVSDTVLDQCKSLQFVFNETTEELKKQFASLQSHTLEHIRNDVKRSLVYFDRTWCRFEMPALEEIEAIHRQACRPLIEAIEADQALLASESKAGSYLRGSAAPGTHRVKEQVLKNRFMEKLCELNRLANIDGKGRGDMDWTCVSEAERLVAKPMCTHLFKDELPRSGGASIAHDGGTLGNPSKALHKCSGCASPVLVRIARTLLRSLARIRRILQRYVNCLYQLNSHLANNGDLVRGLELFEGAWETANRYLVQSGPRRLALLTYDVVSGVQDAEFQSALSNLDPGFLVASLPRALILNEMRRFAAAKASALTDGGQGSGTASAPVKPLKGAPATTLLPRIAMTRASVVQAASAPAATMPRPLDTKRVPSSAFQHSPLARAFLPAELVDTYNETAMALDRLPSMRFPTLCTLLISPPRDSSRSTPHLPLSGGLKQKGSGGAEPKPRTPCPPRMALPNTTRPGSKGCTPRVDGRSPKNHQSQSLTIVPNPDESEDEEDDDFTIDLTAQIQSRDFGPSPEELGTLEAAAEEAVAAQGTRREGGAQDPAISRVVSAVSTLALHLQRAKPHEWNELIQVVLQGFMLVRSARTSSGKACVEPVHDLVPGSDARSGPGRVQRRPAAVW